MKSPYVGDLAPNEAITAIFLVLSKEIRQKKTGEPYLSLHLADKTGEVEAKMWDNVAEVMDTFDRDDFVKVKGLVQVYQNRSQFTIHRVRRVEEDEVDLADFFPCSERDPEEMYAELRGIISGLQNQHLRALLESVFDDAPTAALYKMAPAAKTIHHACRGGLIEHVLSMCTLARFTAAHYKNIDLELLLTGVMLHDIGKIEELTYARSFGYSAAGQLLGHIVLGLRLLGAKFEKLPNFPPKLRMLVEHLIISHHGELEYGSPKVPEFAEAVLLHHLDNMDSKMETVRNALQRDKSVEGEFTGWVAPLERVLLKKDRFLQETPVPVPIAARAEVKPEAAKPEAPKPEAVKPEIVKPEVKAEQALLIKPEPKHEHAVPAMPEPAPPVKPEPRPPLVKPPARPVNNTLFGEKLQAVLQK
jgi:3'-5' exoribonuclease